MAVDIDQPHGMYSSYMHVRRNAFQQIARHQPQSAMVMAEMGRIMVYFDHTAFTSTRAR